MPIRNPEDTRLSPWPTPEEFLPSCSGPQITESPTPLTLRDRTPAVVVGPEGAELL